jgi:hypothetical protein
MRVINFALVSALSVLGATEAHAGKLDTGVFGVSWGVYETFPAPFSVCVRNPEPSVEWRCDHTVGDMRLMVSFAYKHKMFYGAAIMAEGYSTCSALMDTLTSAWGSSRPASTYATDKMDERIWVAESSFATWKYNEFSHVCYVMAVNSPLYERMKKIDTDKAASMANEF